MTTDKALDRMIKARTALVLDYPFWGSLALRLKIKEAEWCPTAATDGNYLYYNRDFIMGLKGKELLGLMAHELLHCFPKGTVVGGTEKPIEDISPGDTVLGYSGTPVKVKRAKSRYYDGELVTVTARGLLPLEATTNHPVLVSKPTWKTVGERRDQRRNIRVWEKPSWLPAGAVTEDHWVFLPKIKGYISVDKIPLKWKGNKWSSPDKITDGFPINVDTAKFLGRYVADGSTTVTKTGEYMTCLSLNTEKAFNAHEMRAFVKERFGYSMQIKEGISDKVETAVFSSRPIGKFLRRVCGAGAHNKKIPDFILYNKELEILRAFLIGYIEGDGYIGTQVGFATVSKLLATQLQLAFARFGAVVNVTLRDQLDSIINGNVVSGAPIYIGNGRSQQVFDVFGVDRPNVNRSTSFYYEYEGEDTTSGILVKVKSVEKRPWKGEVYNLSTENETYVAGNLITHNCVLGHPWRRDGRHPRKWNFAADYVINPMVLDAGFDLPEGCLLEEKYKGQTAEWVYARLPDHQQIEGDLFGEVMDAPNGESGSKGGSGDSEGESVRGAGDSNPPVTEEEWKVAVQQAAAAARARGDLPGALERLVGSLAKPKVNWRAVLRRFIQERCKADYSWSHPSPRYLPHGLYIPAMFSEDLGPLAVYIDTSGSIDATMLEQFGGELQGIVDETKPSKVFIMYWDTQLQHQDVFERGDPIKLHAKGGGGTNFVDAFNMLSELDEEPVAVVFLTDMYAAFPTEPPEIPVLWATPTEDYEAPFGEIVEIRD